MYACFVSSCLCVCSIESPRKLQLLPLSLMLCGINHTCPCPSSFLPRARCPVPLSLPAAASLDFDSDFPRKGLCSGHGVKNTVFLMHSLGKLTIRFLPLTTSASFITVSVLVWHFSGRPERQSYLPLASVSIYNQSYNTCSFFSLPYLLFITHFWVSVPSLQVHLVSVWPTNLSGHFNIICAC